MAEILTKAELEEKIMSFYREHYGESENDVWCEAPAANVRTFIRGGKYISIKSHILTGEIETFAE